MKTKLKLKLAVVLSLSILMNVFLMWELQRQEKTLKREISDLKEQLNASPAS
jgi:hypothetical protein